MSFGWEDSMKNCIDMPIFHTAICFRAKANSYDGRRKFEIYVATSR